MSSDLTNAEKIRGLPRIIGYEVLNAGFVTLTFFGSTMIFFLDELGFEKKEIGFLLALLPFATLMSPLIADRVASMGIKRSFVSFWGIRKISALGLIATPWVIGGYGQRAGYYWIAANFLLFAVCRAVAMVAQLSWHQEIIPNRIRGKFSAIGEFSWNLMAIMVTALAGYVLSQYEGLNRYIWLIGTGLVFGVFSIITSTFVPGGAASPPQSAASRGISGLGQALRETNYRRFLIGTALAILAFGPLQFWQLFLKDQVGIEEGVAVTLGIAISLGAMMSGFIWGWASDRFGSKPVMLSGIGLICLIPFCWLVMPRQNETGSTIAICILFASGLAGSGWGIGHGRYLFVSAVPPERRTNYLAAYNAWTGLMGGLGPLFAGWLIDLCQDVKGNVRGVSLDPFTIPFAISFVLMIGCLLVMKSVHAEGETPLGEFLLGFLRGRPLTSVGALFRVQLARDEFDRISNTQQLGEARSPLSTQELIEALTDPSFNVRYEAIVSAARYQSSYQLVGPLVRILESSEPDLSIAAAWALGRLGDRRAIEPLRKALVSGFPLLEARSARALAALGDRESVPTFIERFHDDLSEGIRIAYGAALGQMQVREAAESLMTFLGQTAEPPARSEIALAAARIIGNERRYMRLWRSTHGDFATTASKLIGAVGKRLVNWHPENRWLSILATDCAEEFARGDWKAASATLASVARGIAGDDDDQARRAILTACAVGLDMENLAGNEYVLLTLHTIEQSVNVVPMQ